MNRLQAQVRSMKRMQTLKVGRGSIARLLLKGNVKVLGLLSC
jgi:hypothetical protein